MERAKAFYTQALDVRPSFGSPGWTTLDLGAIQLALRVASFVDCEGNGFELRQEP